MDRKERIWLTVKRKQKGFTQIKLAEKLGVSNRTISNIERGTKNPSGQLAKKIADELEFGMELFFTDEEESA